VATILLIILRITLVQFKCVLPGGLKGVYDTGSTIVIVIAAVVVVVITRSFAVATPTIWNSL